VFGETLHQSTAQVGQDESTRISDDEPKPSAYVPPRRSRAARGLGAAVALVGFATLLSTLLPEWKSRLRVMEDLLTPGVTRFASGAAALTGAALILVGRGVAARRRTAWVLAVGLLLLATIVHLAKGLDVEAALVTLLVAAALLWKRHLFNVTVPAAQLGRVIRVVLATILVDVVFGVVGLVLRSRDVQPRLTFRNTIVQVCASLVGAGGPLTVSGRFGRWFPASLTALGALTVIVALTAILGPVIMPGGGPSDELSELATLIDRPDGDTLDPFVARSDKRRLFTSGRLAAIGFRNVGGVGLAAGDPVGDPALFEVALQEFVAMCDRRGWRPAVIGARLDRRDTYERVGLRALYIGDEAVIDVAAFTLNGGRMRNVRHACNVTVSAGTTTEFLLESDLDAKLRAELISIASVQRGDQPEFGFSMTLGDLLTGRHPDCLIVICRDHQGTPVAFQRYAPCRHGAAWSLDVMRRLPTAPNGVNERMIVDTIARARDRGVAEISLNFAAFRTLLEGKSNVVPVQAVETWILRRLDGSFGVQIDSLRRFNAKFQPRWVPRCIVYRSIGDLPAIALAALNAEGFLPFDAGRARASLRARIAMGSS
jgi:lysyl-tRNA synthetase, class II